MQINSPVQCLQVLEVQDLAFSYAVAVCLRQQCSWHANEVYGKVMSLWFRLYLFKQKAGQVQDRSISIKKKSQHIRTQNQVVPLDILLWQLCGSLEEVQIISGAFQRRSSPWYNIENKTDLFLGETKCHVLCTRKEVVYKDGKCPVVLQSWSWPKKCNHKSGQTTAHTSLFQLAHSSEQEGNYRAELSQMRLLQAFSASQKGYRCFRIPWPWNTP